MPAVLESEARWGLILGGGEGTRLLPLTRRIAGDVLATLARTRIAAERAQPVEATPA